MPKTALNVNNNTTAPYYRELRYYDTGVVFDRQDGIGSSLSYSEVRTTTNTPGFRSIMRDNPDELPMNPFGYSKTSTSWPYGHVQTDFPDQNTTQIDSGAFGWVGLDFPGPDLISDQEIASHDAYALAMSLKDLKSSKINLGVAFGERKRTASLVSGTIQRVGTALVALRSGNFRKAASIVGVPDAVRPNSKKSSGGRSYSISEITSREWLALQYGWKPLLNDVYGGLEILNTPRPNRVRVSSSRTLRRNVNTLQKCYGVPGYKVRTETYTRKYVYVFNVSHEVLSSLSQVGITNPLSVAWEVLPWSFVLDWFVPVGQYLDSLDAAVGLTFEKGCTTTFQRKRVLARASGAGPYNAGFSVGHAMALHNRIWCTRTPLTGFPTPSFPGLDVAIGPSRIASALALFRTRLKV